MAKKKRIRPFPVYYERGNKPSGCLGMAALFVTVAIGATLSASALILG